MLKDHSSPQLNGIDFFVKVQLTMDRWVRLVLSILLHQPNAPAPFPVLIPFDEHNFAISSEMRIHES